MQIQLGEPHGPCALHLAPQAESPPEPAARSSPLPSVTPFRQPRGRAAQPSGLRSANFYKPDGGWQANQGWLGKQPLAPLAPQIENGAIKTGKRRKRNVSKTTMGFQSCDPSSEPQNPRALGARLAEVCSEGGNARRHSREGGGQASVSVCARVCVRVSAGFLGMCVRGGMCWGCTGFRGNLSFIQTEGACESPPEIGRQKSWRQEGRRKEMMADHSK